MKHILKCGKCGNYTMKDICCGEPSVLRVPPKYSIEDNYADYRRKAKREEFIQRGLL